ncbi:MAG: response regulator [Candidatus Eremiobacteraeota bacterium]|nr:response regulator [Candidatus Eremiobacteraeota bacterium]
MRIVIADDAPALRAVLRRLLERTGHDVVGEADDEATLAAAVRALLPDAVIIDGRLPPSGAPATIVLLRSGTPLLAIYVIAALRETAVVKAATAAGASGAILRPFLATQIAAALEGAR